MEAVKKVEDLEVGGQQSEVGKESSVGKISLSRKIVIANS